jgi:hypothetical protein
VLNADETLAALGLSRVNTATLAGPMTTAPDRARTLAESTAEVINGAAYVLLGSGALSVEQSANLERAAERVSESLSADTNINGPPGVDFDRLLELVNALRKSLTDSSHGELSNVCRQLLDVFQIRLPDAFPSTQ